MKKAIKYFFGVLIFLLVILMVLPISNHKEKNTAEADLTTTTIMQITSFYNKNGDYPKSLKNLPIYGNEEFIAYIQSNTVRYFSYGGDKAKYIFSWRAGAMNWTGYRCTNDKSQFFQKQNTVIRTYRMPGETLCEVIDLH